MYQNNQPVIPKKSVINPPPPPCLSFTPISISHSPSLSLSFCRLCKCSLTEEDCAAVVSAMTTNPSHLKELDLSGNTVGNTGVTLLSALLQDSNCSLEQLKYIVFSHCWKNWSDEFEKNNSFKADLFTNHKHNVSTNWLNEI